MTLSQSRPFRLILALTPIVVIGLLPLAFNAWIDPARLLGANADELSIANALASGHHVTNVMNYDDRSLARHQAERLASGPDILALGSSRMQALSSSAFPGERFVNASVSNGRLGDFIGVLGVYATAARRPKLLLLELDPWSLAPDETQFQGESLIEPRVSLLRAVGISGSTSRESWHLLGIKARLFASRHYFGLSLFSLRHHGRRGIQYAVTDTAQNPEKTRAPDGSIVWLPISLAGADSTAQSYVQQMREHTAPFSGSEAPDSIGLAVLEKVLRRLQGEGVRVELVLPPFHPLTYAEYLRTYPDSVIVAERRYRALAARIGASVHATYNPAAAGVTSADFFDQSHLRPDALRRVVVGP